MQFEQLLDAVKTAFANSYKLTLTTAICAGTILFNPFNINGLLHLSKFAVAYASELGLTVLVSAVYYSEGMKQLWAETEAKIESELAD